MHKKHKTKEWFKTTFSYKNSILPRVIYRALFCTIFALGISYLDKKGYNMQLPVLASVVPSVVIGLLLVFRTNTAYERFWEGRKLWSNIETLIRNISRQILVIVKEKNSDDKITKKQALLLLAAFSISVRQRLEQKPNLLEIQKYLAEKEAEQTTISKNIPADVLLFLQDYLQTQLYKENIVVNQVSTIQASINGLLESSIGCERILKTPIPIAYSIHLKQLLLLYCLTLPFQFIGQLDYWTVPIVFLVSAALLGIEAIGVKIENPFGSDINDINMNDLCNDTVEGMEQIINLEPISPTFQP